MLKNPPKVPAKPRRNSYTDNISSADGYDNDNPMREAYEDSVVKREHFVLPAGLRPKLSKQKQIVNKNEDDKEVDADLADSNIEEKAQRLATFIRIEPYLVGKDR